MYEALKICVPITLMTFAIFTRPNMVVTTGWLQIADVLLVLISTCGITFAMFGRWHAQRSIDLPARFVLAAISFLCMFHPDQTVSAIVAVPVLAMTAAGVARHRKVAPPRAAVAHAPLEARAAAEVAPLLAEAKREIG